MHDSFKKALTQGNSVMKCKPSIPDLKDPQMGWEEKVWLPPPPPFFVDAIRLLSLHALL